MTNAPTVLPLLLVCTSLLRVGLSQRNANFPLAILNAPTSKVVAEGSRLIHFTCLAKGEELEWIVNGQYSSISRNRQLTNRGVILSHPVQTQFGEHRITIQIPTTRSFNLTQIRCTTLNRTHTKESVTANLTVAGVPLSLAPLLNLINSTALELSWDEPFTREQFPILKYTIIMINSSSRAVRNISQSRNKRSHMVSLGTEMARTCSELTFKITATSGVGVSSPGQVSGGFPVGLAAAIHPEADVTFKYDGTPVVEIIIRPPEVCDFQEVFFSIEIYRNEGTEPVYKQPKRRLPKGQMIEAKITSGLQANSIYSGSITFSDTSSQYMMPFSFDTAFHPTAPVYTNGTEPPTISDATSKPTDLTNRRPNSGSLQDDNQDGEGKDLPMIISVSVTCLVVAILVVMIIVAFLVILKRQLDQKSNADQENRNCMVDNPLYEGPIYEIMSENKRLKLQLPKDQVHAQESLYLDNPTQSLPRDMACPYEANGTIPQADAASDHKHPADTASEVDDSNLNQRMHGPKYGYENILLPAQDDDAYTVMSSVGAVPLSYQVDCGPNNGETHSGRYVMDTSGRQRNITLV